MNPTTGAATAYDWSWTTSLQGVVRGDHVNEYRQPFLSPVLAFVEICKTNYTADSEPTLLAYYDDLYQQPVTLTGPVSDTRPFSSQTLRRL